MNFRKRKKIKELMKKRLDNHELIERIKQIPIEQFLPPNFKISGGKKIYRCPLHDEIKGSFVLYPDNHYHCFGCSSHNGVIGFIMNYCHIDFKNAIQYLKKYL